MCVKNNLRNILHECERSNEDASLRIYNLLEIGVWRFYSAESERRRRLSKRFHRQPCVNFLITI